MIEKPSIIITSLGRTGTTFFSRLFRQIIRDLPIQPDRFPGDRFTPVLFVEA